MGHTSEERDHLATPLCGARKKNGERCRAFAGQGTDHPGVGRCRFHLGATKNHNAHAIAVEAKRRMVTMGEPVDDAQPHQVLLRLLRATAGHVYWLNQQIGALPADQIASRDAEVLTKLYDSERLMATRIAEACSRAGVDEAMIKIEEGKAVLMAESMRAVLDGLQLTPGQRAAVGPLLRKQAQLMHGEAPDPELDERARAALAAERVPADWIDGG